MKIRLVPVSLGLSLLAILSVTACGGRVYLVSSVSLPAAIVVDGDSAEWSGALSYVEKDQLFVGFVNDRDNLFICLSKEEGAGPAPGRMGGWTVWFDPAGGSKKTFGLRVVPLGGNDRRRGQEPVAEATEPEQGAQGSTREREVELQWVGANGAVLRRLAPEDAAKSGLSVAEGRSGGAYVLEIEIPLQVSGEHPFAVGAGPDGVVGVGFFSDRAERNGRRVGPPGGALPGGVGGAAEAGPGGGWRGAMSPNMNPDISKSVSVWTRVRLLRTDQPGRSTVLGLVSE